MTRTFFPCRQSAVGKQIIVRRLMSDRGIGVGRISYHNLIVEWPQVIKGNLHFHTLFKVLNYLGVPIFTTSGAFLLIS